MRASESDDLERPVAAAASASTEKPAAFRTNFAFEVAESGFAGPATRVLHPGLRISEDGVKLLKRIRNRTLWP